MEADGGVAVTGASLKHNESEITPRQWLGVGVSHASGKKKSPHHLQTEVISKQVISNLFHSTMPYGDVCDPLMVRILREDFNCTFFEMKLCTGKKKNKTHKKNKNDNLITLVAAFLDSLCMECRWKALKFQTPLCYGHC